MKGKVLPSFDKSTTAPEIPEVPEVPEEPETAELGNHNPIGTTMFESSGDNIDRSTYERIDDQ